MKVFQKWVSICLTMTLLISSMSYAVAYDFTKNQNFKTEKTEKKEENGVYTLKDEAIFLRIRVLKINQ